MAHGEGNWWCNAEPAADGGFVSAEGRRKMEGVGGPTWAEKSSEAGWFQGNRAQATRRMRAET
jgi:hypothetical protein